MDNTPNTIPNGDTYMDEIIKKILHLLKAENNKDKQYSIQRDLEHHHNLQIQIVPPNDDYIIYTPSRLFEEAGEKKQIKKEYHQLIKQLQPDQTTYIIELGKAPDLYEVNLEEHIIYKGRKTTSNGETKKDSQNKPIMQPNTIKPILGATPDKNLKNYTNRQIADLPEEYESTWTFHNGKIKHYPINGTFEDITSKLGQTTAVWDKTKANDTIRIIYDYYIQEGLAQRIDTPSRPGFYWDDKEKQIITVKYNIQKPTPEQLRKAYNTLHQLAKTLNKNDDGERLATIIRWALIAPFQYVIKQLGGETKYLHLYGSPGTGKTTIYAAIPLYMWNIHDEKHVEPGSTESAAQTRHLLGRTSFPIIYDDTKNILNNPRKVAMFKAATTNTKAQGKYGSNGTFQEFPAITPLIFTSNDKIRDEEQGAMTRRFIQIEYTPQDQPTPEERLHYHQKYNKEKLETLQYIGQAFTQHILENPQILLGDQTTTNVNSWLTHQLQQYGHIEDTEWITLIYHPESRQQYNQLLTQQLIEWLQQKINKEMRNIRVENTDYGLEELSDKETSTAVWVTIKTPNQLTWLNPARRMGEEREIIISPTVDPLLQEDLNISFNQAIERLGWRISRQYDNRRDENDHAINDRRVSACRVKFQEFISVVYGITETPLEEEENIF